MAIVITKQPVNAEVIQGKITEKLTVTATGATSYQWKKAQSAISTDNAVNVEGATTAALTIPADLTEGTYYYFCTLSDGSSEVNTDIVIVEVVTFPKYLTGNQAWTIIESLDSSKQKAFASASALSGIKIPKTDAALRTAQIELLMSII